MKIAIGADFHIGSRSDIKKYYEEELVNFVKEVKERKVDLIVIDGDLYDKRISTNSDFNTYANLFINELADYCMYSGARLFILKGTMSHDLYQLDSFIYLTKDPKKNTFIFNTCQEVFYNNCNFLIIPEEYESSKEEYYKDTIYNPDKKYDFVFGHGMFTFAGGYATESGKNNHIVFTTDDFKDNVYGLVVFGHIHIRMRKNNCLYPGSYSRDSFGEEEPKGFIYIEYDEKNHKVKKEEFVENKNAPIYKTINAVDVPEEDIGVFIKKELETCERLRIIIDSDITEEKYNNLKACSYDNNNLFLYKRMRGLSKKAEEEKDKEIEQHRKERRELIEKYSKMDFYEITTNFIKDKYGVEISRDEIKESIA